MDFDRLRRNWENLGRNDPMWAVLTTPGTEGGRWDEREFYASGVEFTAWLGTWFRQHGIEVSKGPALDFGCGAGRLTYALAPHFESVTGIDVSQPMIEFAEQRRATGKAARGTDVRFVCNTAPDLSCFEDQSFEFVLTFIVLQHMRSDYALGYLREFLRVLRPGGLLFFQMPVRQLGEHAFLASNEERADEAEMEMHCTPREQIVAALEQAGGEVLVEEEDRWAGEQWESRHFLVRRRP